MKLNLWAHQVLRSLKLARQIAALAIQGTIFTLKQKSLHLEIASIKLQIAPTVSGRGFSFVKTFTDSYAGVKSATFHEHIQIPDDVLTSDCDLLLIVTDDLGNSTQAKTILKVIKDPTLPNITGLEVRMTSGIAVGVTIKGLARAPGKIAELMVEVQSTAWTRAFSLTDAAMAGQTSFTIDKSIDISTSPAGHYHVNVTLTDQMGKKIGFSYHFDKL
jgi:hypothetical protein